MEFETEYNTSLISVSRDSYHGSNPEYFSPKWKVETDGSLKSTKFSSSDTAEFITTRPFLRRDLHNVVDALRTEANRRALDTYEFSEIFCPNYSCGHHLHFSYNGIRLLEKSTINLYPLIRAEFFKNLKRYSPRLHETIKKQYFRHYAKKIRGDNCYQSRCSEFNLTNDNCGLEWRSFNVNGVQTWKEYEDVVGIALDSLIKVLSEFLNGRKFFRFRNVSLTISEETDKIIMEFDINITERPVKEEVEINVQY
jgi:hypothetical protein